MANYKNVSNEEYNKLINTLAFFDSTRNTLLTFSFTVVLTILGVAIGTDTNPLICLLPFLLIIPFAARIAYYRLAYAHINTFLKTFAPEKMIFANGANEVPEKQGFFYPLVAWLVNHEMVLLSIVPSCTFWLKCNVQLTKWPFCDQFLRLMPIPLIILVFLISNSTYNFKGLNDVFAEKWKAHLNNPDTGSDKPS